MTIAPVATPSAKPLRLWPGVAAMSVQWFSWFGIPILYPGWTTWGFMVGISAGLACVLWWLFLSRAPWLERLGVLALCIAALAATKRVVHPSVAGGGMGMLLYFHALPFLCLAVVVSVAVGRRCGVRARRATVLCGVLLPCAVFAVVRTGGVSGEGAPDVHWRWSATPEERLLSVAASELVPPPVSTPATASAAWPGFRGPERDGVVRGVRIETDWAAHPPVELWRRPVGPAWSSFAVQGELVVTQEQRGEEEHVSCYRLTTGEPVWTHRDPVRFWESNAGAGPRATPTLHGDRVYTMGATGLVNALDAGSGALVWSRDTAKDTGEEVPDWGFSGSPLVVGDLVVVAASGRLVAYDVVSGERRWLGPAAGGGYASAHLATLAGVAQVLLLSGGGVTSVAPADGSVLWKHEWEQGASILQPGFTPEGDVLLTACYEMGGRGMRRLALAQGAGGWTVEERWTSRAMKSYFSDFAVHGDHIYGFDGGILACIALADGERRWKGGRYGHGQLVLLADSDTLLVLSEEGELALVSATPAEFLELARSPALSSKTWNHPVVVGDVLLVRNAEEMAAFRLAAASR